MAAIDDRYESRAPAPSRQPTFVALGEHVLRQALLDEAISERDRIEMARAIALQVARWRVRTRERRAQDWAGM